MTNYINITLAEKLYQRTDKNVTCVELKLNHNLEYDSFKKLLDNLKTANKGSQIKLYFTKSIYDKDANGNPVRDEKNPFENKKHSGFLCDSGENFDKPGIERMIKAFDDTLTKAIKSGVYKVKVTVPKVTKAELELTVSEQAELLATLKEKQNEDKRRIAYLENILKKNGINF